MNTLRSALESMQEAPKRMLTTAGAALTIGTATQGCVDHYVDTYKTDAQTQSADAYNNNDEGNQTPDASIPDHDHGHDHGTPTPDNGSGEEDTPYNYDNDSTLPPAEPGKKFPDIERIDCNSPEELKNMNVPVKINVVVEPQSQGVSAARGFYADLAGTEIVKGKLITMEDGNLTLPDELADMPNKDLNGGKYLLENLGGGLILTAAFGGFEEKIFIKDAIGKRSKNMEEFEKFMHANGFIHVYTTKEMEDDWYISEAKDVMISAIGDQIGNPGFKNGKYQVKIWERKAENGKCRVLVVQMETLMCSPEQAQAETRDALGRTLRIGESEVTEIPGSKQYFVVPV